MRDNHANYFQTTSSSLKEGGINLLHTISQQVPAPTDPWLERYIFPGGYLPSISETVEVATKHGFRLVDYENLRMHYAMTLDEWLRRFEASVETVSKMYGEQFVRMWRYYLSISSGSFRYGECDLSQFVFTKGTNNELPLTRSFLYK